jgi:phosphatidylglycerophosphate synthase
MARKREAAALARLRLDAGLHAIGATGLVAAAGVAVAARAGDALGPAYPLKAVAWLAFALAIAGPALAQHLPQARVGPANRVTLLRAGLVALVAATIGEPLMAVDHGAAAGPVAWMLFLTAAICLALDGVDGWIARRRGVASPFGARFDMELDALFVAVLSWAALDAGRAGPWVLAAGALRYLWVAAAWAWSPLKAPLPPSNRRRAACAFGVAALVGALNPISATAGTVSAAIAVAVLGWSFAVDLLAVIRLHRSRTPREETP